MNTYIGVIIVLPEHCKQIMHQRKAMGGVNASKENIAMIQKQIRILENRVEKAC